MSILLNQCESNKEIISRTKDDKYLYSSEDINKWKNIIESQKENEISRLVESATNINKKINKTIKDNYYFINLDKFNKNGFGIESNKDFPYKGEMFYNLSNDIRQKYSYPIVSTNGLVFNNVLNDILRTLTIDINQLKLSILNKDAKF